jgi:CRP-like cAMP-binding protein
MASDKNRRRYFGPGDTIFRKGEAAEQVYLVQSGLVGIKSSAKGKYVARLPAGSLLGEMAFIDGKPRSASAVAIEPTTCVAVSPDQLQARVKAADPFVRGLLEVLIQRLRATTDQVE